MKLFIRTQLSRPSVLLALLALAFLFFALTTNDASTPAITTVVP